MQPLWFINLTRKLRAAFNILPTGFPDDWQLVPTLKVDAKGWLGGQGVKCLPIHPSWHYAGLTTPDGHPDGVVWHYTDTAPGTAEGMALRRQQSWSDFAADFRIHNPGKAVPQTSWHLSIEANGTIVQMAPLTVGCWHAGSDTAVPIKGLGWANRVTTGIELVGLGKTFPDPQVLSAARVLAALVDAYKVDRKYAMIAHAAIDPKRRTDPGPVWLTKYADAVLEYAYSRAA